MDYRDSEQIRREEWDRMRAREQYAAHKEEQRQVHINEQLKQIDKQMQNERFVARHGEDGAFRIIMARWVLGGVVIGIGGFIDNIKKESFLQSLGGALLLIFFAACIGYWRANKVLNSVR